MRGIVFSILGGAFITLQGVANTRISMNIGTWQAAALTQLTGFIIALFILIYLRNRKWKNFKEVNPMYLMSGGLAAIIIFSSVTSIQLVGATLTISAILIAQLCLTYAVDTRGWFGVKRLPMTASQFIGMAMMVLGVLLLSL